MKEKNIVIDGTKSYLFHNHVDECIGTGRMDLALGEEYRKQLALVQKEIGFSYIRGHGLFSDQMAIYHEYKDENEVTCVEYNFTYLDQVMDSYQKLGLKPFLELGFMPKQLASGSQTIFYWNGNTTPPKDYQRWCDMVCATIQHLMDRYGMDEVLTWPIEVWNEPNLPGFWEKADMKEYFKLFESTFRAIKALNPNLKVGGPAVCGGTDEVWISAFMEFCHEKKLAIDFVTRHHYTTELPVHKGHYGYVELTPAEHGFTNLKTTREIIDRFDEYRGLDIHITEFNTSYIPHCPLHDTNLNASYIAHQLSRLGDTNASYSYWTFGDVFEENGVPFTPLHGGFGLVANGCIPKPTFWSFAFFKQLQGECIYKSEEAVIVKRSDGSICGVLWNEQIKQELYDEESLSCSLKTDDKYA
ncbi:MAG: glycosyl hydrolase, partial [Clostridiales bacterium]|nr:glycosyl hydrolase [Clostridiales bacterium]